MKFSHGCWLNKEHTFCFDPKQAYYTHVYNDKVVICAPTAKIKGAGDTLEGINLNVEITTPAPEIIRVRTYHHKGTMLKGPEFNLNTDSKATLEVKETEEEISVSSGTLTLKIKKDPFEMRFMRGTETITSCLQRDLALIKTDWSGFYYDNGDSENTYMRAQLSLGVGELVYGLGERFTPFVKNGQTVDIWNEDGGTSTQQSYKNIPFYVTNKGYGVFVNHPEKVSFEIASENVTRAGFSVPGGCLDFMVINGPTMKETLSRYTALTGRPSLPAAWTFGLWLSTSFTTSYDEKTVMSFVDGMLDRGIPLRVFHFDCCWMKNFHWTDFVWDERIFPDPEGLLKRLHDKGIKVCVWINPYIAEESDIFEEGLKNGYFVKRANGDTWQWDMWQPGMALVDFTNKDACKWYSSKLEKLMDMGVDCFKTDFGERIPTDVVWSDGSDPQKMHNYYTYIYNKTVFETIATKKGRNEAVLFARSATVGGQQFPVHWGGDCWSDYESMEESLRGGLSLTSSGFGYWSHDIGGFENTSTPDVYKRWAAFGLLSSHSRLHGSSSYRVPWVYDEEAVDVVRRFTLLKASLMPYIYRYAVENSKTGVPVMRSMALEFTEDRNCAYLDKQYMLGESLLVAPVFNPDSIAEFYLPEGKWTNFFTGEVKEGGKWYKEKCSYLEIPLYVRENTLLAYNPEAVRADYDYTKEVTFKAYCVQEGKTVSTVVYGPDGTAKREASAFCRNGEITIVQ